MYIRLIFIQTLIALSLLTLPTWQIGTAQATDNTVLGTGAGANLTPDAHDNTLLGQDAGAAVATGAWNTLVGGHAGQNITGFANTMVGSFVGADTTTGNFNAFFGDEAGGSNTSGANNTYLGLQAGYYNQTGIGNVFVGIAPGINELGSDKLYIAKSGTSAPLIYGEFNTHLVGINGALGVGTSMPMDKLHVRDGHLRIEQTGATHATLNFVANGKTWEIKNNQATGRLTFFSPGGGAATASFKFDRQAVENLLRVGVLAADTVDINGNLVVTGSITPDYVFTPEYPLESIEAHASFMWTHRHLPAVGPGEVNDQGQALVDVGKRSQGMLEELEIAHLYIEQLHGEMTALKATEAELDALKGQMTEKEARLEALKEDNTPIRDQVEALTREVTALKATDAELEALQGQMTEKEALLATLQEEIRGKDTQLEALRHEVRALKALVQQLMGHNLDTGLGKES